MGTPASELKAVTWHAWSFSVLSLQWGGGDQRAWCSQGLEPLTLSVTHLPVTSLRPRELELLRPHSQVSGPAGGTRAPECRTL